MQRLDHLLESNRTWADQVRRRDPGFFKTLSAQQSPEYLWIGCSDSRVPPSQILGLDPGQLFVHRNIANLVLHTDLNCLSVIQFAVDVLEVKHIIVCGHTECGGILAAMRNEGLGLVDNWLGHVRDLRREHEAVLNGIPDQSQRMDKLVELNVIEQVHNVCATTIVQRAWSRGQSLAVHGWVYQMQDGLIRDLGTCITGLSEVPAAYRIRASALG